LYLDGLADEMEISPVAFSAVAPQLDREERALLTAIHPGPTTTDPPAQLPRLLAAPINWIRLFELANRHDVVPLVYRQLQQLPIGSVPVNVQRTFARRAHACMAWNLQLREVLCRLLQLFNQADIPVMPLKGLSLAELLYGDCTLRPTNDLDLLVREKDVDKATQLLLASGCRRHFPPEQEAGLYHYLFSFGAGNGATVLVELHRDLTSQHLTRLDVQQVWAAASSTLWEGHTVWTMRPDDLFLYLCTHAVRDGLGSLKHLLDIARIIEKLGATWCWEDLLQTVRASHIQAPVWLSLRQCRRLFAVRCPPGFLDAVRPRRGIGFIIGQALFAWRGGVLQSPPVTLRSPMGTILDFLWEDSWQRRCTHLRRMLAPTAGLRARKTGLTAATSAVRGYPRWLWQAWARLVTQVNELRRARSKRKFHAP
jgi:hypothetical protein